MKRILLINPNTSARSTEMMLGIARLHVPAGVVLCGVCAARGADMILALAVAKTEVVRFASQAHQGCDGVIVSAFADPGACRLRALLSVPVVGIGEAALREAAAGGRRFGIATTTPGLVRSIEAMVCRLGLDASFTGVRVPSGRDPLGLASNPAEQYDQLALAATRCVALDGAEVVVIGGGPLSDTAAGLRKSMQVAIIEPVPAAIRRMLARLSGPEAALSTEG